MKINLLVKSRANNPAKLVAVLKTFLYILLDLNLEANEDKSSRHIIMLFFVFFLNPFIKPCWLMQIAWFDP
jgi:hypothetical protein